MKFALQALIIAAIPLYTTALPLRWDSSEDAEFEGYGWRPHRALVQRQPRRPIVWTDHDELPMSVGHFQGHIAQSDPWEPAEMKLLDRDDRWIRLESDTDDGDYFVRQETVAPIGPRWHRSNYLPTVNTVPPEAYYVTFQAYGQPEDHSQKRLVMYEEKNWGPTADDYQHQDDQYGYNPFAELAKRSETADLFNYRLKKRQMIKQAEQQPEQQEVVAVDDEDVQTPPMSVLAAADDEHTGVTVDDAQEHQADTVTTESQTTPPVYQTESTGEAIKEEPTTTTTMSTTVPVSQFTFTHNNGEQYPPGV